MRGSYPQGGEDAQEPMEPPRLRLLRRLVTALTVVMILAVISVVALLTLRLLGNAPATPVLPQALTLPEGEDATAVTAGSGWFAVVTRDGEGRERIHVFGSDGTLRQTVPIE